jgi:hypothetical protein
MTRKLKPRVVTDPLEIEFLQAVRALSPERFRALVDCAAKLNTRPELSGHERIRQIALALGYSKGAAAAFAAPLRREHLRVVRCAEVRKP